MTKIKICGITNETDALDAVKLGADALGFVFAQSPRKITAKTAADIIKKLPLFVFKIGVFVNAQKEQVINITKKCKIDILQFHGEENNNYCKFFRKYCKIIKTFRIIDKHSLRGIDNYKDVDAYLFDTYDKQKYGGSGKSFNIDILKNRKFNKPIIIAGGLNLENIETVLNKVKPYAVDICSGVEDYPGGKNSGLMCKFIKKVKNEST